MKRFMNRLLLVLVLVCFALPASPAWGQEEQEEAGLPGLHGGGGGGGGGGGPGFQPMLEVAVGAGVFTFAATDGVQFASIVGERPTGHTHAGVTLGLSGPKASLFERHAFGLDVEQSRNGSETTDRVLLSYRDIRCDFPCHARGADHNYIGLGLGYEEADFPNQTDESETLWILSVRTGYRLANGVVVSGSFDLVRGDNVNLIFLGFGPDETRNNYLALRVGFDLGTLFSGA